MQPQPDPVLGIATCDALRQQVEKLGLSIAPEPLWEQAQFSEVTDPYSQEISLVATWQGRERYGKATFFPDGRVFAEYQVLLPHPTRTDQYVETVQVWGNRDKLAGEAVFAQYLG